MMMMTTTMTFFHPAHFKFIKSTNQKIYLLDLVDHVLNILHSCFIIVFYFVFQVANNKFLKVVFNKFSLGNKTEGCSNDYVEINGKRSVTRSVMPLKKDYS